MLLNSCNSSRFYNTHKILLSVILSLFLLRSLLKSILTTHFHSNRVSRIWLRVSNQIQTEDVKYLIFPVHNDKQTQANILHQYFNTQLILKCSKNLNSSFSLSVIKYILSSFPRDYCKTLDMQNNTVVSD